METNDIAPISRLPTEVLDDILRRVVLTTLDFSEDSPPVWRQHQQAALPLCKVNKAFHDSAKRLLYRALFILIAPENTPRTKIGYDILRLWPPGINGALSREPKLGSHCTSLDLTVWKWPLQVEQLDLGCFKQVRNLRFITHREKLAPNLPLVTKNMTMLRHVNLWEVPVSGLKIVIKVLQGLSNLESVSLGVHKDSGDYNAFPIRPEDSEPLPDIPLQEFEGLGRMSELRLNISVPSGNITRELVKWPASLTILDLAWIHIRVPDEVWPAILTHHQKSLKVLRIPPIVISWGIPCLLKAYLGNYPKLTTFDARSDLSGIDAETACNDIFAGPVLTSVVCRTNTNKEYPGYEGWLLDLLKIIGERRYPLKYLDIRVDCCKHEEKTNQYGQTCCDHWEDDLQPWYDGINHTSEKAALLGVVLRWEFVQSKW